jgi:Icc-related predicted phosphoesterase
MKILVVGDKESTYIYDYFDFERFKDVDFVISTGDLKGKYLSYIVTLLNVPLYYVPGNHDSSYVDDPPEGCINIDRKFINHNGVRIMGLGGSMWYNGGSYQYSEREMYVRYIKMKPQLAFGGGLDILVAHAPAHGLNDGKDKCHTGFETFLRIMKRYEPKIFIHGHQHLNYGHTKRIIEHNSTVIINSFEYYLFEYDNPTKKI